MGNGPLNDYGRAVSATAISSRELYSKTTKESEIAENSSFFFGAFNKNTWLRPSIDYRGIQIESAVNKDDGSSRFINMQGSVSIALQNKDRSLISVADIGHAPAPFPGGKSGIRSREHYVGYRPSPNIGIYTGLMDIAYGIRLVDHTAFSRRYLGLAQNDQTHGVLFHYMDEKYEFGIHGILGNLFEENNLRQSGGSIYSEFSLTPKWHLGSSLMMTTSSFKKVSALGVHSRNNLGKKSILLTEVGAKNEKFSAQSSYTKSIYAMIRTQTKFVRGLFFNTGIDHYLPDLNQNSKLWRYSLGLQVFPIQRVELRFDLSTTRTGEFINNLLDANDSEKSFDFNSQLHLWF